MAGSRTIAVTGASRGIGAAICRELLRRGYRVACLSRSGCGPKDDVPDGASFINERCDVSDETSVKAALAAIAERTGGLHGLVNNAGIHVDAPSHAMSTATYERVMATNATGLYVACREAYPHLVRSGGGTIVNIGSFFDRIGVRRNLAYCASKAAVGAMTRCLAVEWACSNIRVLDVAPGYIDTDLNHEALASGALSGFLRKRIPVGRPGTAAEVARLVGAIYDEDIAFLNGATIYIDGGQGIAH
jgi:NAD(P)-dependent dehydrogenase (short-subunit alcohol dehydrogenase family)